MASHSLITLSSTQATRITPLGMHSGLDITIQNINVEGYVFVGAEGVTASNYGYRIGPSHAISFELPEQDSLYLIADTNGLQAAILKTNLEK